MAGGKSMIAVENSALPEIVSEFSFRAVLSRGIESFSIKLGFLLKNKRKRSRFLIGLQSGD
jgi:hypothetical protein